MKVVKDTIFVNLTYTNSEPYSGISLDFYNIFFNVISTKAMLVPNINFKIVPIPWDFIVHNASYKLLTDSFMPSIGDNMYLYTYNILPFHMYISLPYYFKIALGLTLLNLICAVLVNNLLPLADFFASKISCIFRDIKPIMGASNNFIHNNKLLLFI